MVYGYIRVSILFSIMEIEAAKDSYHNIVKHGDMEKPHHFPRALIVLVNYFNAILE